VAFFNGKIVIADAGKRKVYIYNKNQKEREIEGISGAKNLHGFVIPSLILMLPSVHRMNFGQPILACIRSNTTMKRKSARFLGENIKQH
jgi:hypothetical protein